MNLKKIFTGALVFMMCFGGHALRAEEAAAAATTLEDKLLPLVTMETGSCQGLARGLFWHVLLNRNGKTKGKQWREATKSARGSFRLARHLLS